MIDSVAPVPGNLVLEKTRHSFFAYTELDPILRSLGVTRLLVAGLQTNVCVEATVRAALEQNDDVAVAEDAVSTDRLELNHGALDSMRSMSRSPRSGNSLSKARSGIGPIRHRTTAATTSTGTRPPPWRSIYPEIPEYCAHSGLAGFLVWPSITTVMEGQNRRRQIHLSPDVGLVISMSVDDLGIRH
ncbi:cysteine hydrolase family protein [Nocardia sp. SYP-A9097]|uniref:cysteine hydrolase family protein n=1 Tax=Nocardia sp. SYP-A9097 TaxID=2663237 RepID=UPI001E6159A3|nr:isochorismatase family cysteine hydrolase [Nocardia sp. SYP-A9097]